MGNEARFQLFTASMFPAALRVLTSDAWLLFVTRFTRLFAYGSLSVILILYLVSLGLSESQSGLVLTLTLAGDVAVSLYLVTRADRIGRRRMLVVGAVLMVLAGLAFAVTINLICLIIAGTIGVISPSGHEVKPFLSIEQAALSHLIPPSSRTEVFAWCTLTGVARRSDPQPGAAVSETSRRNSVRNRSTRYRERRSHFLRLRMQRPAPRSTLNSYCLQTTCRTAPEYIRWPQLHLAYVQVSWATRIYSWVRGARQHKMMLVRAAKSVGDSRSITRRLAGLQLRVNEYVTPHRTAA
jgi:hypothetical protein